MATTAPERRINAAAIVVWVVGLGFLVSMVLAVVYGNVWWVAPFVVVALIGVGAAIADDAKRPRV